MTSIEVTAPAKVNLFLKVLGKRRDSYHNILTLFERISLADRIRISKISDKDIILTSNKKITSDPKDNLAHRAAKLILDYKKVKSGVKIRLDKRVPVSAGLGGGSSDAAAVLAGINRLFNLNVPQKMLLNLGGRLGADVPFFLTDTPFAFGSGKGSILKKVGCETRFWHLLIWPGFGLSTKDIYKAFDAARGLTIKRDDAKITLSSKDLMDFSAAESMLHNDLEEIAKSKNRLIGSIIERLAQVLDKRAILSGSGPSLFCLYRTRKEAANAKRKLLLSMPESERKLWQTFIVRTC